jgi:hypothetical protein
MSCRIYRDETGRGGGAPSVAALRQAVREAAGAGPGVPGAAGRSGLGRLAPVEGGLRAVQQRVLRSFAQAGRPPVAGELDRAAAPYGTSGVAVLHDEDFLRLDQAGAISTAYPFSAGPTRHVVQIEGGPSVFSMCAIDALGIAAMVGRSVLICSAEPGTGTAVTVTVPAGRGRAVWEPKGALVYSGRQEACGTCVAPDAAVPSIAADVCCGFINFFASRKGAAAWAAAHPEVTGQILSQRKALLAGIQIFGSLLRARP